ncbi:carboxyvinyl-carboxyphosphonate phosphorylmutase [Rhodococcus sp. 06-621-2]|nr:isocitrate lyase/PEP mutase family protein [Rhodococcus sp. 06-621-2]OZC55496.1 carboxyvinyl-carboxyphosphonate phosphorylmutase [Rhodococcus sp. 06-621-2]
MTKHSATLRQRLTTGRILTLPGAANALTARLVEDAGFEAVYVTGAGVSNTYLGVPDLGMLTLTEIASHVAVIRRAVDLPLVVDADTGFGNAVNVAHTVAVLEQAGADAIQLEDQTFPKKCGHFAGKSVIDTDEMVGKIRAAVSARSDDMLIIARTDALAIEGLDAAIERAAAYRSAGADVLFVEAPRSREEMGEISSRLDGPLLINIVEGGATPSLPPSDLGELGYSIALYANLALLAGVRGTRSALDTLRTGGTPAPDSLATWTERQALVQIDRYDEMSRTFGTAVR